MKETISRPSSMLHFLLFLVFAASGFHCLDESRLLLLQDMQWRDNPLSRTISPQRSRRENGATILEMKQHIYSSGRTTDRDDDLLLRIILSDEARVSSMKSRIKNAGSRTMLEPSSETQLPLSSGIKLHTLNYIVTVELGGRRTTLIVDTGSDLTWIQCKPCFSCYNQQDPIFDPTVSPSYQAIPCNSSTCDSVKLSTGLIGNCGISCNYAISYGDGSYTRGSIGSDRIGLGGINVDDFVFGCGRLNHGLFGGVSGLMGLGKSQLSLVSQTSAQFGGVFSYCLPTRESGSLIFGGHDDLSSVYKNSTPIMYTTMISDEVPFYYLNLTGIRVGGVDLQPNGLSSKILIDSGTVISRFVPSLYMALRDEFLKQFATYPSAPGFSILDTCFNLMGYENVEMPTLKLQFEGDASLDVDASGILYFVKPDASQVCLAITSLMYEDDTGIIGNYQQKNLRVVYDTVGLRLGFARETCGYSS